MTTLLSRVGALESRLASQTLWVRSKRKRAEWVCAECKSKTTLPRQRAYSDASSLKFTVDEFLFPAEEGRDAPRRKERPRRFVPPEEGAAAETRQRRPWGLGATENTGDVQESQQHGTWETMEAMAETTDLEADVETAEETESTASYTTSNPDLFDIDYVAELPTALMNNNPDMVARCLTAATLKDDLDFIRSIPNTAFSECIRILQPCNFTEPLTSAHVEVSDAMAKQLGFQAIHEIAEHHAQILREIISIRRSVGNKIGMPEYRMLFRAARDLGNENMARNLWKKLVSDGHAPDVACYNAYMASTVFNGVHTAVARQKLRVIPIFQLLRQAPQPGNKYGDSRYGGSRSLKEVVTSIFGDMLKDGVAADEESFRNVIMAAAREGHVSTVKSVLRKVWDVDVDALVAGKDESTITPKPMSKDSPLYPTTKLLFSIAHAFGINNDMPTALRIVDFVARSYEIEIEPEVWAQLFEWTFVLSTPRTNVKSHTDGSRTGALPLQSVLHLWQTMTGPPYNIQPTIGMYNHLIRNLQHRHWTPLMHEKMCEGRELYYASRKRSNLAFRKLSHALESQNQTSGPSDSLETIRRDWEQADLIRKRNLFWCKRWLRLLLSTLRSWVMVDQQMDWSLREIPQILWEWRFFAPTQVRYETAGGLVEFNMRAEEEVEGNRARIARRREREERMRDQVPLFVSGGWVKPPERSSDRPVAEPERDGVDTGRLTPS